MGALGNVRCEQGSMIDCDNVRMGSGKVGARANGRKIKRGEGVVRYECENGSKGV